MNANNFQQAVEWLRALPLEERRRLRDWLDEQDRASRTGKQDALRPKEQRFQAALKWLDENRAKYLGQWVALDGERLLSHGPNGRQVHSEAQAAGVEVPLLYLISEEDELPFGGW